MFNKKRTVIARLTGPFQREEGSSRQRLKGFIPQRSPDDTIGYTKGNPESRTAERAAPQPRAGHNPSIVSFRRGIAQWRSRMRLTCAAHVYPRRRRDPNGADVDMLCGGGHNGAQTRRALT
ncbi:hypothetical protein MTO96_011564 [Rhipicephalus appendiculatus]